MDVAAIHRYLSEESYWAGGIPVDIVESSIANSFCAGAFVDDRQVAFGRVITDYTTFGWFADFYVLEEYRGQGIAKELLNVILHQPWCMRLRRKMLNTRDAHGLYRQFGFTEPKTPEFLMEVFQPGIHLKEQVL